MIVNSLLKLNRACLHKILTNRFATAETYLPYAKYRDHVINGHTDDGLIRFAIIDCSNTVSESLVSILQHSSESQLILCQTRFEIKNVELQSDTAKTFCFAMLNASFHKVRDTSSNFPKITFQFEA